jgi:hypothetical protein
MPLNIPADVPVPAIVTPAVGLLGAPLVNGLEPFIPAAKLCPMPAPPINPVKAPPRPPPDVDVVLP